MVDSPAGREADSVAELALGSWVGWGIDSVVDSLMGCEAVSVADVVPGGVTDSAVEAAIDSVSDTPSAPTTVSVSEVSGWGVAICGVAAFGSFGFGPDEGASVMVPSWPLRVGCCHRGNP
ncbi:hypothetical protein Aple_064150 [Acrocarpospora pleiomorpha]|uniref:Uncharacterized protein n=1 Tax=Acrocarpospora pleiomorpha TaxID=90975 RepID=A0A5M3XRV3_9ACTN|nr:hypothetical protein Aple_064150 [Acrocarpospora pleiomorpha]